MKKTILTLSIFFLFCLSVNATVANPKGEIKAIFSENFDAMTEGSENEPAADSGMGWKRLASGRRRSRRDAFCKKGLVRH